MALTENLTASSNASLPQAQGKSTNNLLDFVNLASSNIVEAFGKQKKKKRSDNVNVRKFIERRVKPHDVKRLKSRPNSAGVGPAKAKSAVAKPSNAAVLQRIGARSWPQLTTVDTQMPVQTVGLPSNYSQTSEEPSYSYSLSELNMYPRTRPLEKAASLDPELESILSQFNNTYGLDTAPTSRRSSECTSSSVSPCYTPQPTSVEAQVRVTDYPYSPYSDSSDELCDDSAYSSPVGSVRYVGTNACSPPVPSVDWSVRSPPTSCSMSITAPAQCEWNPVTSSSGGWMPFSTSAISSIDQGLPMTPTVSQLLLDTDYF